MPVSDIIRREICSRFPKIRCGLVIGFDDSEALDQLRVLRGGVWVACAAGDLPYDDSQFEVVVANGAHFDQRLVREAHRVLMPGGCLYFAVPEKKSGVEGGFTLSDIYGCVREGFDIVSLTHPRGWWIFGGRHRVFTVCARRKNWREHNKLRIWL